ncbi:hypothetical protein HmCmsJML014_02185 [Escherichia coli]|nr:hypothetical protein HmCmsJML014_02185 [Escherichia coli]
MTVSIGSPFAAAVKPRSNPSFSREHIPAPENSPWPKALGRHRLHNHIPAPTAPMPIFL